MSNLKQLRSRIAGVKATRKITMAMKMVAASKLLRAQSNRNKAKPYLDEVETMLAILGSHLDLKEGRAPRLVVGTGADQHHLVLVLASDRGLCGSFNHHLVRLTRWHVDELLLRGKDVSIFCVGRKAEKMLNRDYGDRIIRCRENIDRKGLNFEDAKHILSRILYLFERDGFDVCEVIHTRFKSVIRQQPVVEKFIPRPLTLVDQDIPGEISEDEFTASQAPWFYKFEPQAPEMLEILIQRVLAAELLAMIHESVICEQAARMTAMDGATSNADRVIQDLTLDYNRSRQTQITRELIEIISGAESI